MDDVVSVEVAGAVGEGGGGAWGGWPDTHARTCIAAPRVPDAHAHLARTPSSILGPANRSSQI